MNSSVEPTAASAAVEASHPKRTIEDWIGAGVMALLALISAWFAAQK